MDHEVSCVIGELRKVLDVSRLVMEKGITDMFDHCGIRKARYFWADLQPPGWAGAGQIIIHCLENISATKRTWHSNFEGSMHWMVLRPALLR